MAKKVKNTKNAKISVLGIVVIIALIAVVYFTGLETGVEEIDKTADTIHTVVDAVTGGNNDNESTGNAGTGSSGDKSNVAVDGKCTFTVIDCGQADSILIQTENSDILVDTGESKSAEEVMEALDRLGVDDIELIVGTHAHADHINGMQKIVETYDIEKVLMSPRTHTTKTYENLLKAIKAKGLKVNMAKVGDVYEFDGLTLEVVSPIEHYEDLNASSVVLVATYGETRVLLTGDAEKDAEEEFYSRVPDIDVLKAGHHGSSTSSSEVLLDQCKPEVALISCGVDNKYGHPHKETIERYDKYGMKVYRTDEQGEITLTTDGKNYEIKTER